MAKADWSSTTGFVLPSLCQLEGSFGLGSSWFGIGVLQGHSEDIGGAVLEVQCVQRA